MNARHPLPRLAFAAAVALALQACATNSALHGPPAVALPGTYHSTPAAGEPVASAPGHWAALGDPVLADLLARAEAANLDVAAAKARIDAARAAIGVARSAALPSASAGASAGRQGISKNGLFGSAPGNAFPQTYTLERVGLDASWELDLFGEQRAYRRQAEAGERNAVASLDGVRLSLSAEVARVYVEHATLARMLASNRQVVALREQALALVEQQNREGQADDRAVAGASAALESARAGLPSLEAEVAVRCHAMGELLGTGEYIPLPEDSALLGGAIESVAVELGVQPGLPADLLRRRPDVRQAEARWAAAGAGRDAAYADQFPHISLTSSLGLESLEEGTLFKSASRYWSVVPQVSVPLFDGGRRRSTVHARTAELEAAAAEYRKAVVGALTDVEQALLRHRGLGDALAAQVRAIHEADVLLDQEKARYDQGESSLVQWLEAQRQFENQRQVLLQAKRQALLSYVLLHKSLGGDFGLPKSSS